MSSLTLGDDVPGVFAARQKRSIRIRDKYLEAGVELLNSMRFSDLRVSDLAKKCGGSVGSFYTRFQDKEAYFRALRSATIIACNKEIDKRVNLDRLYEMETGEAMDELVDLIRILDPEDPWEPMRASARNIMFNYRRALSNEIEGFAEEEAGPRLNFCFQLIVGALQNDLVNDYHVFSTRDESLRQGLKEAVRAYLRLPVLAS
jgi:AcrR family transcriptional regulator